MIPTTTSLWPENTHNYTSTIDSVMFKLSIFIWDGSSNAIFPLTHAKSTAYSDVGTFNFVLTPNFDLNQLYYNYIEAVV